jgi:hypothetical protein
MGWKEKKWIKNGSKWQCKVGVCIVAYSTKWLLTKHLKEVHGLVVEKAKVGKLLMSKKGLGHQGHVKMNVPSWQMPWSCRCRMIKRLLFAFVPKLSANGMNW